MSQPPNEPAGLGTPGPDRPDFAPPPPRPWVPPAPPTGGPAASWGALPAPGTPVAPPSPGWAPARSTPRRGVLVAAVLAGGLLMIGLLSALPLLPSGTPTPTASAAAPVVVTVSPSAASTTSTTLTSGGGLGRTVAFGNAVGRGTVTVTSATWTDVGEAAPVDGERYLVVELALTCRRGVLPVGPILVTATAGGTTELPGFGPALSRPLAGQVLAAGDRAGGELGFALAPGPVELSLLSEDLDVLATVEIPAP